MLHIFYTLLYKAGQILPNKLKLRMLAGTWIIATLTLGICYTSIITSFILEPNFEALVDSIEDLATKDKVILTVPQGGAPDLLISVRIRIHTKYLFQKLWLVYDKKTFIVFQNSADPLMKKLKAKLDSNPNSRCNINKQTDCVDLIKKGSAVLFNVIKWLSIPI